MALKKAAKPKELKPSELKWKCDPDVFDFDTTTDLKPIEGIIGQERALKALKLGVELKAPGYNIFVTGLSGTGKFTTIKKMLESISPDCSSLHDYAYVNNFEDQDRPTLLVFPAGNGIKFKNDLSRSIKFLQERIPQVLTGNPFLEKKKKIVSEFGQLQQKIMSSFEDKLKKDNFTLGQVKMGEVARPEILAVIEDQPVFIQQLDEFVKNQKITTDKAKEIITKYSSYQEELQKVFREGLKLSQEYQEKITKLEKDAVEDLIHVTIKDLQKKYNDPEINTYLEQISQNILEGLDVFKGQRPATEQTEDGFVVDYLKEYEVNIILDNSKAEECPVIIESSPTFTNLFGTIEKYSDGKGGWYADFTKIKAGSLLRANGGYLVINALDAFGEPGVWKTLKRVLLYGKMEIQEAANFYQFAPSILKPEPIDIDTKVIFIGNNYIYSVLSGNEDDFNKIFKVKADFDYEMPKTDKSLVEYAKVVKRLIENENLLEFDKGAIAKITEYGARYAGEKNKLTTRFAYIADLAREASFWAKDNGDAVVASYHVDQAFQAANERHALQESKISEMINDGTIMIDTSGTKTGTINGLAVYGNGHFSFGKPTRITASVSLGGGNIINVEREAGLSGNTHNKGVLIISGYFREKFGKRVPLSFTASLVFEQGYGMIDGDSASITEISALLSCLSDIPIKQSLAITGSVNQKGDIQPIGGVNEKIEGFFDICKVRGLKGDNGVIIPHQNVKDLMLKDEILDAVANKKFHIYPVSKVEEAVEILTGIKAGELGRTGKYEADTVFGTVEKQLEQMRKAVKPQPQNKKTIKSKTQPKTKPRKK